MKRRHDWHKQLAASVQFNRSRPFEWGKHDCALFACNTIQDMTGVDLAHGFRGKYSTAFQAARAIRTFTEGGDLEALAEKICNTHGISEVPVKFAQRGDLVIVHTPDSRIACGIVGPDPRFAYAAGKDGLTRVAMREWLRAWRIT